MRDLIRKILKEYTNRDVITLEEITLPEGIIDLLIIEGKARVKIPSGLEKELMSYISKKYNWPPTIEDRWCSDIKEKEKNNTIVKSCNKVFKFELSIHWLRRLFRKDESEYKINGRYGDKKIENPSKTEGIDLFFDSKNKINDFIDNASDWSHHERKYILLTKNNYQNILALKKEKKGHYLVEFITQIKGERFFDTPELKKTTYL